MGNELQPGSQGFGSDRRSASAPKATIFGNEDNYHGQTASGVQYNTENEGLSGYRLAKDPVRNYGGFDEDRQQFAVAWSGTGANQGFSSSGQASGSTRVVQQVGLTGGETAAYSYHGGNLVKQGGEGKLSLGMQGPAKAIGQATVVGDGRYDLAASGSQRVRAEGGSYAITTARIPDDQLGPERSYRVGNGPQTVANSNVPKVRGQAEVVNAGTGHTNLSIFGQSPKKIASSYNITSNRSNYADGLGSSRGQMLVGEGGASHGTQRRIFTDSNVPIAKGQASVVAETKYSQRAYQGGDYVERPQVPNSATLAAFGDDMDREELRRDITESQKRISQTFRGETNTYDRGYDARDSGHRLVQPIASVGNVRESHDSQRYIGSRADVIGGIALDQSQASGNNFYEDALRRPGAARAQVQTSTAQYIETQAAQSSRRILEDSMKNSNIYLKDNKPNMLIPDEQIRRPVVQQGARISEVRAEVVGGGYMVSQGIGSDQTTREIRADQGGRAISFQALSAQADFNQAPRVATTNTTTETGSRQIGLGSAQIGGAIARESHLLPGPHSELTMTNQDMFSISKIPVTVNNTPGTVAPQLTLPTVQTGAAMTREVQPAIGVMSGLTGQSLSQLRSSNRLYVPLESRTENPDIFTSAIKNSRFREREGLSPEKMTVFASGQKLGFDPSGFGSQNAALRNLSNIGQLNASLGAGPSGLNLGGGEVGVPDGQYNVSGRYGANANQAYQGSVGLSNYLAGSETVHRVGTNANLQENYNANYKNSLPGANFNMNQNFSQQGLKIGDVKTGVNLQPPNAQLQGPSGNFDGRFNNNLGIQGGRGNGFDFGANLPTGSLNVPNLNANVPSASLNTPNLNANAPGFQVKAPEVNTGFGGTVKSGFGALGTGIGAGVTGLGGALGFGDSNAKANLNLPSAQVNLKAPALDINAPKMDMKTPGYDYNGPNLDVNTPKLGWNTPNIDANAPKLGLKAPNLASGTAYDLKSSDLNFKAPSLGYNTPNLELNAPNLDANAPKLGFNSPNLDYNAPRLGLNSDYNLKGPNLDISTPKLGMNVNQPDLKSNLNLPNANVDLKTPEVKTGLGTKMMAGIGAVGVGIGAGFGALGSKLGIGKGDASLNVNVPSVQGNPSAPNLNVNVPKADLTSPNLNLNAPNVDANLSDWNMKPPKLDVNTPKMDTNAPKVGINAPNLDINAPKFGMNAPNLDLNAPKYSVNTPNLDVNAPKFGGNAPNLDFNYSKISMNSPNLDLNGPKYGLDAPSLDFHAPKYEVNTPNLDLNAPKYGAYGPNLDLNTPNLGLNAPNADFKYSKIGINSPNVGINAQKFDMNSNLPSGRLGEIKTDFNSNFNPSLPRGELTLPSGQVGNLRGAANINTDLNAPKLNLGGGNLNTNVPDMNGLYASGVNNSLKLGDVQTGKLNLGTYEAKLNQPGINLGSGFGANTNNLGVNIPDSNLKLGGIPGQTKLNADGLEDNFNVNLSMKKQDTDALMAGMELPTYQGDLRGGLPSSNLNVGKMQGAAKVDPSLNVGGGSYAFNAPDLNTNFGVASGNLGGASGNIGGLSDRLSGTQVQSSAMKVDGVYNVDMQGGKNRSVAAGQFGTNNFAVNAKGGSANAQYGTQGQVQGNTVIHQTENRGFFDTIKDKIFGSSRNVANEASTGLRQGQGRLVVPGEYTYDGNFVNGKFHGRGTIKYQDGRIFVGEFKNDLKEGHGRLYDATGMMQKEGIWVNDQPI